MKLGIIGYGRFGKLIYKLAQQFVPEGDIYVFGHNPAELPRVVTLEEVVKQAEFIVPAVQISKIEEVVQEILPFLSPEKVIVDVASVKEYPAEIYQRLLPKQQVILTHPMFGPGNVENSADLLSNFKGKNFVITNLTAQEQVYLKVKRFLESTGLNLIEMSARDHDRISASNQFITIVIAMMLRKHNLTHNKIDTVSSKHLKQLIEMVQVDISLLLDMYKYNRFAKQELEKLELNFAEFVKIIKE